MKLMMKDVYTLITGASSGIGKEIAVQLSKSRNVLLHGRDLVRLNEVRSSCSAANKVKIWPQDLDLVDDLENALAEFMTEQAINIAEFVHCAGYMKMAPLKMSTVEVLKKTFNINVISASLITRVLLKKNTNNGILKNIVFISSNLSNRGAKGMSAYGASKGALDTLMRCLAVELAPKIRVNSILPGAVITQMTQGIFENKTVADRMTTTYPLGLGEANDVFQMVSFLLSDQSKWISGQQFTVDGGRTINISG